MIDVKITEEERKNMAQPSDVSKVEHYPHGLKLHINEATMKKLMISELPDVESEMIIMARVSVVDARSEMIEGSGREKSMTLQITEMDLKPAEQKEKKETTEILYGS